MKTAKEIKEELEKEHGWNFRSEENMEMYYELFLDVQKVVLRQPPVSGSLPFDFLQNEMIKAIKDLAKESTAPDKDTPDWLESDIKRGAKWIYTRLTGNDC